MLRTGPAFARSLPPVSIPRALDKIADIFHDSRLVTTRDISRDKIQARRFNPEGRGPTLSSVSSID